MNVRSFLPIITLCIFVIRAAAQNAPHDNFPDNSAAAQAVNLYNGILADQAETLNGHQYNLWPPAIKGSPYFTDTASFRPAKICYNNTWYKDVPVLYDVFLDAMVSSSRNILYTFRNDKLSDVYLLGHHFIYLNASAGTHLAPGYYDELYGGKSQVLVKHSCEVIKRTGLQSVETIYEQKNQIYIKKGDVYFPVSSKGSVLEVFSDKAKPMKQYIAQNKIAYRKDKEGSVLKLATYYDELNK